MGIINISILFLILFSSCTPAFIPIEAEIATDIVENVAEDIQKHESKK